MKKLNRQTGTFPYVPRVDRALPVDQQTIFVCRALTQGERMALYDDLTVSEVRPGGRRVERSNSWQQARELVLSHVVEIRNFPAGAPEPWPAEGTREVKERYLDGVDEFVVFEVGNAIRERAEVSDAAGN